MRNSGIIAFSQAFALRTGLSDKDAMCYCREFIALLQDELLSGRGYTFTNFGAFTVTRHRSYVFKSNLEKGDVYVPERLKVKFKIAPAFKEKLRR